MMNEQDQSMEAKNISLPTQRARSGAAWFLRTARALRLLLLLLLTLPAMVQAQFNYLTNNGTIIITGYTGPGGAVDIPDTINGLPVTSVGSQAFYGRTSLTSVTIPNSVMSIGYSAFFGCTGLTNVTIPSTVTNIGSQAFSHCASLASVTIPGSVTTIDDGAFWYCTNLVSVTIPSSVTSIGFAAFSGCARLTSITIPSSVTSVAGPSFSGCTGLAAIIVDSDNSRYASAEGVLFDKNRSTLIRYPEGKTGHYAIPSSVSSIGEWAFSGCASLTNITIPSSVTSIGLGAFYGCTRIASVTVPSSVANIRGGTFSGCTGLTSVTISRGVTSVAFEAFIGCSSLASVTIPSSVTSIASSAFSGCTNVKAGYFEGNAPSVGSLVFEGNYIATIFYLPGTTGWGPTFGGRPSALWKPVVQVSDASFGVRTNQFGFNINWASGRVVVLEACTDLAQPVWSPVGTNTLTDGSSYFSDPQWTNHSTRFYRLRSP